MPAPRVKPVDLQPPIEPKSSTHIPETSVASLDHDPNADRRKRRKTDKGALGEFERQLSPNGGDLKHNEGEEPAGRETAVPDTPTSGTVVAVEIPSPCMQEQQHKPAIDSINPSADETGSKKQKIVKLNANGKLLSSPVANKFGDKSKKGNKRARSLPQKPEKKLVTIRYNTHGGYSQVGRQIDEILSGKRQHAGSNCIPHPTPATSAPAPKQAAKATHPFFLKKAAPKPGFTPPQGPIVTPSEDGSTIKHESPPSRSTSRPLMSFRNVFSKVPEPMHPLWPPFGLTHVRDTSDEPAPDAECNVLHWDLRKSKNAAVQVNHEESVLSAVKKLEDPHSALRVPDQQVSSGRELQAETAKQLTIQCSGSAANKAASHEALHPAIARLYTSLPASMSPFDCGECETQLWVNKYAPISAQQVLCATKEALMLRDWLKHLIVSSTEMGTSHENKENRRAEKKRKRQKKTGDLDDFIVFSEDEASEMGEISDSDDELAGDVTVSSKRTVIRTGDRTFNVRPTNERNRMTNAILLSGPSGCGKTASVYAVAKEMDFEVFEINPGSRRSAKDILDRIGDMTQNHLVHNLHDSEDPSNSQNSATDPQVEDAKQNTLAGIFKPPSAAKKTGRSKAKNTVKEAPIKQARSQKQSLILLEEADILFEEDKQFWTGVLTLIKQSKRPIVITCNDENLVPLDDISFHAILRFRSPLQELAVDYLLLMAANEGHILERMAVEKLYLGTSNDLRRSIMDLNYWCQMAVGSEKSGLDWLLDRWPQGKDLDQNGDKLRMLSTNTYDDHMGWFSRDVSVSPGLTTEAELKQEAFHWWHLGLQEADAMEDSRLSLPVPCSPALKLERLENLCYHSDYMDARSAMDILAAPCSLDARNVGSLSSFSLASLTSIGRN